MTAPDSSLLDAWPPYAKAEGASRCAAPLDVVEPDSLDQLREVLASSRRRGAPVVVSGGRSNVVGATASAAPGVSVSTRRLARVISIDRENLVVRCGAGILGAELEAALNEQGLTLGHYPQSLQISTVGGWIATRAIGTYSGRFGGIEHLLIALEAVLPDGTVIRTPAAPRTPGGPDLAQLFVGAEGTLGVVTEATLRIALRSEVKAACWALNTVETGLDVAREVIQRGVTPSVVRLWDADGGQPLVAASGGAEGTVPLLVAFDGDPRVAEAGLEAVGAAATAAGGHPLDGAWEAWHDHRYEPPAFLDGTRTGYLGDAIDVCAWWSALPHAYHQLRSAIIGAGAARCRGHFSHVYAQGSSIYLVTEIEEATDEAALARYDQVWEAAMETCLRLGVGIVHHHGIGAVRNRAFRRSLGSAAHLLDRVRGGVDQARTLNPDRLA